MEYQISLPLAAAIIIWLVLALIAFILGIGAGTLLSMRVFKYILGKLSMEDEFVSKLEESRAKQDKIKPLRARAAKPGV